MPLLPELPVVWNGCDATLRARELPEVAEEGTLYGRNGGYTNPLLIRAEYRNANSGIPAWRDCKGHRILTDR